MYKFTNLPTKKAGPNIESEVTETTYKIFTSDGWIICEVGRYSSKGTASDIADAIRFARDAGYEQALSDVRNQLGIKA